MRILLFGGTSEGSELAAWLAGRRRHVTLCVATGYGAAVAPQSPYVEVRTGRLEEAGIEGLIASHPFCCAVDATHPYAAEVSKNLSTACARTGLPYLRLVRREGHGDWLHMPHAQAAGDLLLGMEGNVLLTTGSKELDVFARPGLLERCFPRVLPSLTSLRRCLDLGFPPAHVICMQGPFSQDLNEAILRQLEIRVMVTKDSGAAGGFVEKAEAAAACHCTLLVIDRPVQERGLSLEGIKRQLEAFF